MNNEPPIDNNNLSVLNLYNDHVAKKSLKFDDKQFSVVKQLNLLQAEIYQFNEKSYFNFFKSKKTPKGIYLYGDVGCGKSLLMELFYNSTNIKTKKRLHFHNFMQHFHEKLHLLRKSGSHKDPIKYIAQNFAKNISLLCFDEFFVNNITDAMLMARLFEYLFKMNVILVTTSNVAPKDLYKDGLQRENFLPFIDILSKHVKIIDIDSSIDYRKLDNELISKYYYSPANKANNLIIHKLFKQITHNLPVVEEVIKINNRKIILKNCSSDKLLIEFENLCDVALASADYLEIAENFKYIFITNIPYFTQDNKNSAHRFINLIDILYDNNIKLICSAADLPENLCRINSLKAFNRTVSRLNHMKNSNYYINK